MTSTRTSTKCSPPKRSTTSRRHLRVLRKDGEHGAARRQLLVLLGKPLKLPLIGQKEVALGCVLLIAVGAGHAPRHPVAKLVVLKPLDDSLSAASIAHAADGAQHRRQTRAHLGEFGERRSMELVDWLAAAPHQELRGCFVLHRPKRQPCQLRAKRFHNKALASGYQDRDSTASQLLERLELLLVPNVVENDEAASALETPSNLVIHRVHTTALEPLEVLWWSAKQPEDAIAKGAAHARVAGEPVGSSRLAEARSASDARHRARTNDADHRAIASDAIHEGGTQIPLLWTRHELGRPGGEAAARGSRVKEETACVHFGPVFRVNVELELLHPSAKARIQVPGLRLGADRGARLLKGLWRLGSRGYSLSKGRAEYAARCIFKHSLPADHVRYECQLAQRSGQACGAAAGEHDQLQLAGEHMRSDRIDERIDGHGLKSTTHADKGEDRLRL
eukprot:scaffold9134_cov67-Phaeocystis_antarctica.AAC.4